MHHEVDIRERPAVLDLVKRLRPSVVVHAAGQPSPDRAAAIPLDDFETNAVGSLNLLEAARQACPEAPFVHMSTNKVYGDTPNRLGHLGLGAHNICRRSLRSDSLSRRGRPDVAPSFRQFLTLSDP